MNGKKEKRGMVKEIAERKVDLFSWEPKTKLGKMVKNDEIKNFRDALKFPEPIREVEIVDKLLPELREEIISVGRVQRVTDSGRRMRFRIVVAVGNEDGCVSVGEAKGKEAGPTIRKAIRNAKLGIKEINRGCGSWECGCNLPHTVPFKVEGKGGSVRATLLPAPSGTGLVASEIPKKILTLAGIKDVYVKTKGHTRTTINFSYAIMDALSKTTKLKISDEKLKTMKVSSSVVD